MVENSITLEPAGDESDLPIINLNSAYDLRFFTKNMQVGNRTGSYRLGWTGTMQYMGWSGSGSGRPEYYSSATFINGICVYANR